MNKKLKQYLFLFMLIIASILLIHILCNSNQACYGWEREIIKKEYEIKPILKKDFKDLYYYKVNFVTFLAESEYAKGHPGCTDLFSCALKSLEKSEQNCPFKITHLSNMNVARVFSKAIRLKNGNVLIIGGNKSTDESAELFNLETNKFELITNAIKLSTPCFKSEVYPEPLLLPDGEVYYNGIIYNPETNKFSEPKTSLSKKLFEFDKKLSSETKQNSKFMFALQSFLDATVLIGKDCTTDKICSEVYLYDPIKDKEYKTVKLNTKNYFEQASKISRNDILILSNNEKIRGYEPLKNKNGLEIYNTQKNTCKILNDNIKIATALIKIKNYFLFNNFTSSKMWKFGYQQNLMSYNLKNNTTSTLQSLSSKKLYRCLLKNNYALFSGSYYIDVIDISKNELSRIFDPNISWRGQSFTVLKNGDVLITGGKFLRSLETYTQNTERSTFAAILKLKK